MASEDELNKLFDDATPPEKCTVITDQHFGSGSYCMTLRCEDASAVFVVSGVDNEHKQKMILQFDNLWNCLGEAV